MRANPPPYMRPRHLNPPPPASKRLYFRSSTVVKVALEAAGSQLQTSASSDLVESSQISPTRAQTRAKSRNRRRPFSRRSKCRAIREQSCATWGDLVTKVVHTRYDSEVRRGGRLNVPQLSRAVSQRSERGDR